jgi:predicted nucleic acid-binding protein
MPEVFADTGYWVALFNPNDQLHQKAREVTRELGGCQKVTTEMVLVEFLNFVSGEGKYLRRLAGEKVKELGANPDVEVVAQTSGQFQAAVDRYLSRLDHSWSVVDCASFLLMEERGIQEALAFDRHFEQAGFTALLR